LPLKECTGTIIEAWNEKKVAEAALLRLIRVKCGLLSMHPLDQMFDPVKEWLICDPGRHETVMLDLLVDLNALLTH